MSEPRDSGNWAKPVEELHVGDVSEEAGKGNVEGRKVVGPMQGFGQMWQKTYKVRIDGATPEDVVAAWKDRYGEFWPDWNKFYPPPAGIQPGEVAVIEGGKGPAKINTGVFVVYADDRSWSYMTPEGHPFAGMITFSAYEPPEAEGDEESEESAVAQVQLLIRNADPLYEMGFKMFGGRLEDKLWQQTLRSLADAHDSDAEVETEVQCIDRKRQWDRFGNITKNSALRTLLRRHRKTV